MRDCVNCDAVSQTFMSRLHIAETGVEPLE